MRLAALAGLALSQPEGASAQSDAPPILVVGTTPLPGTAIPSDKVPGEVQKLAVPDLATDRRSEVIASLVAGDLASVSLSDESGSRFQPDFAFRGFTASPIAGVAQGLVVYQDGVRLNEAFGDIVNWDLMPVFAMRDITIQSDNPAFGLNALGGAVTITMKDGLNSRGISAEASGGSFGAGAAHGEYGARLGDFGVYLGLGLQHESGWREHSPATLRQAYGDLGYRHGKLTLHLSATAAVNDLGAVGPTPVELLAANPRAVFTWPQSVRNSAQLAQLRASYAASAALSVSAELHLRHFTQTTRDGNITGAAACANDPAQLCLGGAGQFPADALYDDAGAVVLASALPARATPGEIDHTRTATTSLGATLQAAFSAPIGRRANKLTIGASLDHGATGYAAYGELGVLANDLAVTGTGVVIDQALSPNASPPIEGPVNLRADNRYLGLYAIDVLDLTPRLSVTLSGRWNAARITLADQTGSALNAAHDYAHFNPGAGLAWQITGALTAYAGYAGANRAPTAGELSCANPAAPCALAAFLVSDPPLRQVIARSIEAGLRGRITKGALSWNLSAFRTVAQDDILLVATAINGFGYFTNAGATRRQGIDANLQWQSKNLRLRLGYCLIDASFRSALVLSSNSPSANAAGLIMVASGDRLPLTPRHRLALSAQYTPAPGWSLGTDLRWHSGTVLRGDESNQQAPLPGYASVNLHAGRSIGSRVEIFADVENLLGGSGDSYGAFTTLGGLPPALHLTNPRSVSPGEPRSVTLGVRLSFG